MLQLTIHIDLVDKLWNLCTISFGSSRKAQTDSNLFQQRTTYSEISLKINIILPVFPDYRAWIDGLSSCLLYWKCFKKLAKPVQFSNGRSVL